MIHRSSNWAIGKPLTRKLVERRRSMEVVRIAAVFRWDRLYEEKKEE